MQEKTGKVWLVGAGPGDPGLLTVKGQEVLAGAEVVVYDRLVGPGILARIPPGAETIDVGKRAGSHPVPQEEINRILLSKAREGKRVVRLKGGDPFVFGRGGEELALLAARGVPFEIVPGITSAVAVPAYAGIPVTHRGTAGSFHVITGHTRAGEGAPVDYAALAALEGTLVFLMGLSALGGIAAGLLDAGMDPDTPAAVLQSGTTARQRCVLSTLREAEAAARAAEIESPAIIVVGKACALSEELAWADSRPLQGVRVLLPHVGEGPSALAEKLSALGAETAELTVREAVPPANPAPLGEILGRLGEFSWLLFDGPACVRGFFDALLAAGKDSRALAGLKIAAGGPGTEKALFEYGLRADLLLKGGGISMLPGKLLLVCAEGGGSALRDALRAAALPFEEAAPCRFLYRERCPFPLADFLAGEGSAVAFPSLAAAEGFLRLAAGLDLSRTAALCIGEKTAARARLAGMQVLTADPPALDGMAAALAVWNCARKAGTLSERRSI